MKQQYTYGKAYVAAQKLVGKMMNDMFSQILVVGSLRRKCEYVHDIDIVAIPTFTISNKIISGEFEGIPFEIYIADANTFETLTLIRTGSAEFNRKLCTLAKQKGYMLKADGTGLTKDGVIIDNTERGIIEKLLGHYVEPSERV